MNKYFVWPLLGQIPLSISSVALFLSGRDVYSRGSSVLAVLIVTHIVLFCLATFINFRIYKSDKFAKIFRVLFFLPMVGVFGWLGIVSFIPYGSFFLAVAINATLGVVCLAYLVAVCMPAAMSKKSTPESSNISAVSWGVTLLIIFTVVNFLAFTNNIKSFTGVAKDTAANKSEWVGSGYDIVYGFGYVPPNYKSTSSRYDEDLIRLTLECEGEVGEEHSGTYYVRVYQYVLGNSDPNVYMGDSWMPFQSDLEMGRIKFESEDIDINGSQAKYETKTRFREDVYQERGEYGAEYRTELTDIVEDVSARLVWEEGGLITEVYGETLYDYDSTREEKCSVDKAKLIRVAESLEYAE